MSIPSLLRSPRLTLALCLLVGLWTSLGTLLPQEGAARLVEERFGEAFLSAARFLGFVDTYSSPLFVVLLLALVANVAACSWHRTRTLPRSSLGGRARLACDLLMHLSVPIVLAGGALKWAAGSVATQYLFLGQEVTTAREGGTGPERPLGFGLLLKERVDEHYPLALQVGVRDSRSGEKLALLVVREGRPAAVAGRRVRLEVGPYDVDERWVTVRASGPDARGDETRLALVADEGRRGRVSDLDVELLAWRRDLKQVRGRIAIVEGGREVEERWLAPNGRLAYRGTNVLLTAWGEDRFRNPYFGIQVTRDPWAPLFWTGVVIFSVATPCFLILRHARAAALTLGLLLAPSVASAQQPAPGVEGAPPMAVEARSGIRGRVLLEGAPAPGARVLVYPETQGAPIGPGFLAAALTDSDGRFDIGLSPGRFKVGVRRRAGADGPGFLLKGDYRADVRPEIVEVTEGGWIDLGDLALRPIDPEKLAAIVAGGFQERTANVIAGRVTRGDGMPLSGYFVQAYRDPEMKGRPDAVTEVRADGTYTLYLPSGGVYALRARSVAGGPLQPGEQVGVVAGVPDSRVEVGAGETLTGIDLVGL